MALKILQPGVNPLGQFDLAEQSGSIAGGECIFTQTDNSPEDTEAYDVSGVGPNIQFKVGTFKKGYLCALADEGSFGYGTAYGDAWGGSAGQTTSLFGSNSIGPNTGFASGKVTAWHAPGLYGVSGNSVRTSSASGVTISNESLFSAASVNSNVYSDSDGSLICGTSSSSGSQLGILIEKVSDSSLVSTSQRLAGSTPDTEYYAIYFTGSRIDDSQLTSSLVFEGAITDDYQTTLTAEEPTGDRTITLPDETGTVLTNSSPQSIITSQSGSSPIINFDIKNSYPEDRGGVGQSATLVDQDGAEIISSRIITQKQAGTYDASGTKEASVNIWAYYDTQLERVASFSGKGGLFLGVNPENVNGGNRGNFVAQNKVAVFRNDSTDKNHKAIFGFYKGVSGNPGDTTVALPNASDMGGQLWYGADGSGGEYKLGGGILAQADGAWSSISHPLKITFHVSDLNEDPQKAKMCLSREGFLSIRPIGNPDPTFTLDVEANAANSYAARFLNDGDLENRYGIKIQCGQYDDTTGTNVFLQACDGDGNETGQLKTVNGSFQLSDTSDIRLKKDIEDSDIDGVEICKNLKVRKFNWKNGSGHVNAGFIANEVIRAYPDAANGEEDGVKLSTFRDEDGNLATEQVPDYMTVSRDQLVPVLVKAIQQLEARIKQLEGG